MKTIDFTPIAGRGFPFDENTMQLVQNEVFAAAGLANLGGKQYILSGCDVVGGTVSDGVVVINGEILAFIGGNISTKVVIVETNSPLNFRDDASMAIVPINVVKDRVAQFGDDGSPTPILWADFKRNNPNNGLLARVDKIEKMLKPLIGYDDPANPGTTVYGSWLFWGRPAIEIPAGWEAVPDAEWKGRVPVVLDPTQVEFDAVGKTGGEKTHVLTINEMPQHDHDTVNGGFLNKGAGDGANVVGSEGGGNHLKTGKMGGDQAHNNLQPYKVVMFIRFAG